MMILNCVLCFLICRIFMGFLVAGNLELPHKCLADYTKDSPTQIYFCTQESQDAGPSTESLCQPGYYLSIDDFNIHLSTAQKCEELGGFDYNKTVTASCLQEENKNLAQQIARTLITAYNAEKFKHVNRSQVQKQLSNIVKTLAFINVKYSCNRAENATFIDICKNANVEGWNKGHINLDNSSLEKLEPKPTVCVCSVRSSNNNVTIKPVDVRLRPSENLQVTDENGLSVSNLFQDSSFIWSKDNQKQLASESVNITLKIKDLTFTESLWIEIEGQNMSVFCSPLYRNDSDMTNPTEESPMQSGELSPEIIISVSISIGIVLVLIIIITVYVIHRRRNNTHNSSLTEMEDSFSSKPFGTKGEVIYSEPGTPTPVSDSPKKPLMTNYFELDKEHIYAEPGPANNNSKNITSFSQQDFSKDKNKEKVIQKNIYNHLGERPANSHGNIYDTSGNKEYSTVERNKRPKVVDNVYDQ